jgi:hypothetical protein
MFDNHFLSPMIKFDYIDKDIIQMQKQDRNNLEELSQSFI